MIDDKIVKRKKVNKFLGVLVDENLSWNPHIDYIESKISKNLGILYKTRHVLGQKSLAQLYFSFINSYLNYGNIAWVAHIKLNLTDFIKDKNMLSGLYTSRINLIIPSRC